MKFPTTTNLGTNLATRLLSIILISLIISLTNASPAPAASEQSPPRFGTDIRYCDLKDFGKISFSENKSKGCQERIFQDNICYNLTFMDKSISSYWVQNGCCAFYREHDCKEELFKALNRQDTKLEGAHNDATSSIKCNVNCDGL
ncbi:hypothetical protein BZA77DRAFT_313753 [Pyronema omphalodes]|nr:hypothetical protein BZA77DRAFT_313753 [Pyronema omphalodes]